MAAVCLPFLYDGDVVELEPMHSLPIPGDMVLVQCPEERYVLHRVVRLESDGFFCAATPRRTA